MRITTHPFTLVFSMALTAALTLGASSLNVVVAQEAASPKEIGPIIVKAPQGDQPDPKVMEQLEAIAKKYKFANYAEYDDVAENVGLVMSGIDPNTKKYVGPDAVIKKDIALID